MGSWFRLAGSGWWCGRIAILSYRHFERSREIFLADRWRSMFEARKTQDDGVDEGVVSLQGHVRCQPQCKKDPSATLGMTKGGADGFTRVARCLFRRGDSRIAAFSPCGEGAPQGRIGHRRYERGGEERLKSTIMRVPYPPLRGPPSPMGKAKRSDASRRFL